jgi:hypothetical protein
MDRNWTINELNELYQYCKAGRSLTEFAIAAHFGYTRVKNMAIKRGWWAMYVEARKGNSKVRFNRKTKNMQDFQRQLKQEENKIALVETALMQPDGWSKNIGKYNELCVKIENLRKMVDFCGYGVADY